MKLESAEHKLALIEAVLFVSKDPVEPERLLNYLRCRDISEFESLLQQLELHLAEQHRGIALKRSGGGLQFVTRTDLHENLKEFYSIRQYSRLSLASLESLSIIAYRQPITLAEISDLRGVNSSGPVKNLLQKKLIRISGRKRVPGTPALYSTTREFLTYFGLNDLAELPSLEELTELFEEKEQPSLFK